MSVKRAIQILEDVWEDFKDYFDERCRHYSSGMKLEEAERSHWICWSEFDLLAQLARFYYKRKEKSNLRNIEIHINESLKPSNFKDYEFYTDLKKVKEKLGGRAPQPDLTIVFEDSFDPFILCAQAKPFILKHSS